MQQRLLASQDEGAEPEDADEYRAENIFWVPKEARWSHLQGKAKQPTIGKIVDDAMVAIERDNPRLKGILPKDYARPALDKQRLGELIDLIGTIGLGDAENRSKAFWAGSTNTSSRSLPVPRARRAASSTRPAASSACWSRCSPRTRAACSTLLRLGRHVRAEREVRGGPRWADR
jgi:hypothetical protein